MEQEVNQPDGTIRVLVADNSPFHTELLAGALTRDPDLQVIPSSLSVASVAAAARTQPIDVFVLSAFGEGDAPAGLSILGQLREMNPQVRAVILLNSSNPDSILGAFHAGARGVFHIQEDSDVLRRCIRAVHQGQAWVSREQMTLLLEALISTPKIRAVDRKGMNLLTKREAEVVRCLSEGMTNREIAERIGLSQHTVKNYLFRIFDKLGVSNRIELLFMTMNQGTTAPLLLQGLLMDPADGYDEATFVSCQKAAENGVVAAQLALARMMSAGRKNDRDLAQAYAWFRIAGDQIAQSKRALKDNLTPAQAADAEIRVRQYADKSNQAEIKSRAARPSEYFNESADSPTVHNPEPV
ncbi:MAG TPA: LuxR C-terminal-related transcriptional regulator [Terriglobales bacterium]|nr:LuxR C-terminal-related transcriptional regulator [Terriglobales bacterium]